eukprot:COSAG06_NODE_417_length_15986_cov_832.025493_14_plen_135_part_00
MRVTSNKRNGKSAGSLKYEGVSFEFAAARLAAERAAKAEGAGGSVEDRKGIIIKRADPVEAAAAAVGSTGDAAAGRGAGGEGGRGEDDGGEDDGREAEAAKDAAAAMSIGYTCMDVTDEVSTCSHTFVRRRNQT